MATLAAAEPLFKIIADGAIELEADVAEVELPNLKAGQVVAVTPAGSDKPLEGTIRLISPEVDKASRLGRLRIALIGNPPVAVGSFARGVIETGRKTSIVLPLSAITYARGSAMVQAVKDGRVTTTKVTLGLIGGQRVQHIGKAIDRNDLPRDQPAALEAFQRQQVTPDQAVPQADRRPVKGLRTFRQPHGADIDARGAHHGSVASR